MSRRVLSLVIALACAAIVSACGSSSPSGHSASSSPTTATVTRTVTGPGTTQTSSTTASTTSSAPAQTSTTAAAAGAQCVAADLSLVSLGGGAATGHELVGLGLRNTSGHTCRTGGYPGVQFLAAGGEALATHPDHTTSDFFGQTALRELTVAPDGLVSFRLGVTDVGSGGLSSGCVQVAAVQIIAPNDTATMRLARRLYECGGDVSVSPLQAGAAALH